MAKILSRFSRRSGCEKEDSAGAGFLFLEGVIITLRAGDEAGDAGGALARLGHCDSSCKIVSICLSG